ncbi:MAG TPA: hypothetical protein PKY90_04085 [Bacillota bacterium]|nr:hypothetical protein [Bacillota bacterium]
MRDVYYFKFIGARTRQEKADSAAHSRFPTAVAFQDIILDCDEKAFKEGVRPGDTVRQAQLASPSCQIIITSDKSPYVLTSVIDVLSSVTLFVELDERDCGVFLQDPEKPLTEVLSLLDGMFDMAIVTKSRSKFLTKCSSIWVSQKVFKGHKILSSKKSWGRIEVGNNYILVDVEQGKEKTFLANMPLALLWPLPPDVISILYSLGFKTFKDLQQISPSQLTYQIGDWAHTVINCVNGEDISLVNPLTAKLCIEKIVELENMDLDKALKEVAEEFAQNGLGAKHITVTLAGDFPPVVREKKSIRPLYSFESLKSVVSNLIQEVANDLGNFSFRKPSTVSIFFRDIEQVSVRQMFLMEHFTGNRENRRLDLGNSEASVSLESVLSDIEKKYGESVLAWGWECEQKQSDIFRPEILRREKMLSFWDPTRFREGGEFTCPR